MNTKIRGALLLLLSALSSNALAAIDNRNVLNSVIDDYEAVASGWASIITTHASWLFWTLVVISMVWTFGMMALRKADIGEFFAEFVRFTVFTGFYYWLLANAASCGTSVCPTSEGIGPAIINGLAKLGAQAAGIADTASPSSIVDMGFSIWDKVKENSSYWSPVDSAVGLVLAAAIVIVMALIAINMLLVTIASWIMMYAGIFILGFGGARWTSDMAVNYYKSVLGLGLQLMTMVLLVGVGKTFLDRYYTNMQQGVDFTEMMIVFVVALTLLVLVNKVPGQVAGLVTGAGGGGSGIGSFGAGAAMGAAGMAAAGVAMGGAALASSAASLSGGAQALMSAFKGAQSNVAAGTDVMSKMASSVGGGGSSSGSSGGGSPLASAMGLNGSGASGSSASPGAQSSSSGGKSGQSSSSSAQGESSADAGSGSQPSSSSSSGGEGSSGGDTAPGSGSGASDSSESPQEAPQAAANGDGGSVAESSGGATESGAQATAEGGSGSVAESSGGATESGAQAASGGSKGESKLATAGRIAADMASTLAKGAGRMASNKAASMVDSAKARVADTAGAKLAEEIRNPGAKAQERQDSQDIAKADQMKSAEARQEQAEEARQYLSEKGGGGESQPQEQPAFDGDSIGGSSQLSAEEENEIAEFRDSKNA